MESDNDQALIIASLELAAETAGDITPAVYERYFAKEPKAVELMSHIDDLVRGKMMVEVMRLLMLEKFDTEADYLKFETKTHAESYSVPQGMYASLLVSVQEVVAEATGAAWTTFADSWQRRIDALLDALAEHAPPGTL